MHIFLFPFDTIVTFPVVLNQLRQNTNDSRSIHPFFEIYYLSLDNNIRPIIYFYYFASIIFYTEKVPTFRLKN